MRSALNISSITTIVFLVIGMLMMGSASAGQTDGLYEQSRDALRAGQYQDALNGFRACAEQAEPGPEHWRGLLGVALAYDHLENPIGALEYYRKFFAITRPHRDVLDERWSQRRETIDEQMRMMSKRLLETHGMVSVVSDPVGAQVYVNGKAAGVDGQAQTPFALYLKPGTYTLRINHPGRMVESRQVVAVQGRLASESFELKVAPTELKETAEPLAEPSPPAAMVEGPSSSNKLAWGLTGAGLAAVVTGAVFHGMAMDARSQQEALDLSLTPAEGNRRYDELDEQLHSRRDTAWALYAIGGAVLGYGIYRQMDTDPSRETANQTRGIHGGAAIFPDGVAGQIGWVF